MTDHKKLKLRFKNAGGSNLFMCEQFRASQLLQQNNNNNCDFLIFIQLLNYLLTQITN